MEIKIQIRITSGHHNNFKWKSMSKKDIPNFLCAVYYSKTEDKEDIARQRNIWKPIWQRYGNKEKYIEVVEVMEYVTAHFK